MTPREQAIRVIRDAIDPDESLWEAEQAAIDALDALLAATREDCTDGRVPGAPLVLLAPRQVGCGMTVDERHAQFSDGLYQAGDYAFEEGENFTNAPWEPLYAAQTEEKQA